MPPRRHRRMNCAASRRCGRRTWIRTVRNRRSCGRCANAGSRWAAAATTGWSRCAATCSPKSPRNCSSASTASSTPESTRWPGRASPTTEPHDRDDPDEPVEAAADDRSHPQKQHDALAVLLTAAAASGALPTLGGAAPTLVVSVREEDLATGRGYAHLPGDDQPIPLAAARHIACTGAVQRVVTGGNGRIVSIETLDRVFTHHQRRRSPSATADASSPAATSPRNGARSTTSKSTPAAGRPTPTTASCSAGSTTAPSTPAAGRSG